MKNSVRRGLFHPDDIKVLGLSTTSTGPLSAPLPGLSKPSRSSLNPITAAAGPPFGPPSASARGLHSRSSSFVGTLSGGGSFGRAEARRIQSQTEFGKYTEEDEEDYEDVFGKSNGTGERFVTEYAADSTDGVNSDRTSNPNPTAEHPVIE
jgi:hypothetical protein